MSEGFSRSSNGSSSAIATLPNALSVARILLTPAFVWLIVDRDTTFTGLLLFGVVVSTDWLDGYIARRTGQVSEVGKMLDPTADRLAIAAGLVALVVRGAFPLWAALLILVRDVAILIAGVTLLVTRKVRIEVRVVGKVATFSLVVAIGLIAWGNLGYPFPTAARVFGWGMYAVGIVEYYVATALYAGDLRRALESGST
ncbi:MAG TPA: CDP-alcohol phosphatidyltransferase family protein [Actinomycetota bacterium]|nr:CDP-alcohol phosphatidyltransferase family protein [Actinomycetota bacterium]